MTTRTENWEVVDIDCFNWWRDWGEIFWQYCWIDWIIMRKTYVEEKRESPMGGDDSYVTNTNTGPSVFYRKISFG